MSAAVPASPRAEVLVTLSAVEATSEEGAGLAVVHDVTWTIAAGEWWAVCGEAASGKSALLAAAAGLTSPTRGHVRLLGIDPVAATEGERTESRRRVGFVFEGGGRLFGQLSVSENVALAAAYHENLDADAARARALALLALAGLESLADASPPRLPLSVQRRVALLRALAAPVRLLFLDDPLRGLSPRDVRWWLDFLRSLRARRAAAGDPLTLVTSGSDLEVFRGAADRSAWVEEGRFEALPAPAAVPG